MSNIFETATRNKFRFKSNKGELSVEDLWDLSLPSLDTIAKEVNRQLKATAEESFISQKTSANSELETKLEVLKYVINKKLAEKEAQAKRAETIARKAQLQEILLRKREAALENMSEEEIQNALAELNSQEVAV